jgi:hypothetical protein
MENRHHGLEALEACVKIEVAIPRKIGTPTAFGGRNWWVNPKFRIPESPNE